MKQSTKILTCLLCCVLLFTSVFRCSGDISQNNFLTRYHVQIINELADGRYLDVHCKSKDDDLGLQHLGPNGGNYMFSFRINFGATTLFWCNFWYNYSHAVFNVFEGSTGFIVGMCGGGDTCTWKAQVDGFYLYNNEEQKYVHRCPWGTS
ncbi:hypothetical protein SLE2022_246750 [Rubroshorea leprosula]